MIVITVVPDCNQRAYGQEIRTLPTVEVTASAVKETLFQENAVRPEMAEKYYQAMIKMMKPQSPAGEKIIWRRQWSQLVIPPYCTDVRHTHDWYRPKATTAKSLLLPEAHVNPLANIERQDKSRDTTIAIIGITLRW